MPLGEARESLHIKMEPEEPHPEGMSQEARAQGARGWMPLSQGAKEKVCFLPGGGETENGERGPSLLLAQVGRPGGLPRRGCPTHPEPTDPPLRSGWG